jgi:hypothetical protein
MTVYRAEGDFSEGQRGKSQNRRQDAGATVAADQCLVWATPGGASPAPTKASHKTNTQTATSDSSG